MSVDLHGGPGSGGTPSGEETVDLRRYLEALRTNRWLIAGIVVAVTVVVLVVSLAVPKRYEAKASVAVNNPGATLGSGESQAIQRALTTLATFATTHPVLAEAAASIPGETPTSLSGAVSTSVGETAYIIDIKVSDRSPARAAALANAVARAFIKQRAAIQQAQVATVLSQLNARIAALRASASSNPSSSAQATALEARAAELEATAAGAGSQLQLVQPPSVPSAPSSPRTKQNVAIALVASIFVAMLVVLAREQLTPRVTDQRELGQLLGLPILGGIPHRGGRAAPRKAYAEEDAYQTLSAALRLALPARPTPRMVLVTSATHREGKTTVTARLGRTLAEAGYDTLLISADLRWPRLDGVFGVTGRPGLRELLARASDDQTLVSDELEDAILPVDGQGARGKLDILPVGERREETSEPLHTAALGLLIARVRATRRYSYVLIDTTPILGVADAQLLVQFCEVLLVARLDRLKLSHVVDLRDTLKRLDCEPLGIVVIGAREAVAPYPRTGLRSHLARAPASGPERRAGGDAA
jgi:capsular polysaccharide biosynthesis protein/Mrp family chromosome partitioning ATPase